MARPDLTIACVLWMGAFRGRDYDPDWVRALQRQCARNAPPHRFVCLTNTTVQDVETLPLPDPVGMPGWWSKISLFCPGNGLSGRVLYLDLDCLVTGDLSALANYPCCPGDLVSAPPSFDWLRATGGPSGGPGIVDRVQSSAMLWEAGTVAAPWERWTPAVMSQYRGDQDWIGAVQGRHSVFPGEWFCKLKHCQKGPPPGVKVVASMPWKCREAADRFEWVREVWAA
jgi:hypothetical protein